MRSYSGGNNIALDVSIIAEIIVKGPCFINF